MNKAMFVVDENYGDYVKIGPFDAIRVWEWPDVDGRPVLLCSKSGDADRKIRVSPSFGIFIEDVD